MPERPELRAMITGFRLSAALNVAAELGLSDLLASGPRTVAELAAESSADEDTLHRLLHALATVGVYDEREDGRFALTELGEGLRSDVPGSLRPLARTLSCHALWSAYAHLGHSVRTGENAFEALHGHDVWTHRRGHPDENEIFNQNMTALTSLVAEAVAEAYDFSAVSTVVDVGGGQGLLLETVLDASSPPDRDGLRPGARGGAGATRPPPCVRGGPRRAGASSRRSPRRTPIS